MDCTIRWYNRFEFVNKILRKKLPYFIICLDVINFRKINERHGVKEGDLILKEIISCINECNTIYKENIDSCIYEKDTFIMVVNTEDKQKIKEIIRYITNSKYSYKIKFRIAYRNVLKVDQSISFIENINKIIRQEKYEIRYNTLETIDASYDIDRYKEIKEQILLSDGSNFNLVYQPKMDLNYKTVISCEVLSRWNHEELGFIPPSEFIPIIKDLDKEYEFDLLILNKLCQDIIYIRKYLSEFSLNMSINTLKKKSICNDIYDIVGKYNIDPRHITIEVLEHTDLKDYDLITKNINRLSTIGFNISIDDFGTGYSSYYRLSSLNFSEVKIAREFLVDNNIYTKRNKKILSAMISLCKELGCKIVSEGIETENDEELMISMGADYGQGYLYSKPLEKELFIEFLNKYSTMEV